LSYLQSSALPSGCYEELNKYLNSWPIFTPINIQLRGCKKPLFFYYVNRGNFWKNSQIHSWDYKILAEKKCTESLARYDAVW
jgi:hypothetical protein